MLFVKVKFSEFLQKIITEPETIRASNVMLEQQEN